MQWLFASTVLAWCVLSPQLALGETQPPSELCTWPDQAPLITLAEFKGHAPTVYEVCSPGNVCMTQPMEPGHPLQVYRVQGAWSCGYYQAPKWGGGQAWVRTAELHPVAFDPHPALTAWIGTWLGPAQRVRLDATAKPGTLTIDGRASWHGAGSNVHLGDLHGQAAPLFNHLHFVEDPGNTTSCTVDLTLYGRYLVASDNDACGALNVRFQGVWRRAASSGRASLRKKSQTP